MTTIETRFEDAHAEGKIVAFRKGSRSENPYPASAEKHRQWLEGFNSICDKGEEAEPE